MDPFFTTMALAAAAFWGSVLYLALRFVRAAERRGVGRGELDELRARVGRLEEELAAATTEVERLAAGERFTTQLLAGRAHVGGAAAARGGADDGAAPR